jgi:hypothetical protein
MIAKRLGGNIPYAAVASSPPGVGRAMHIRARQTIWVRTGYDVRSVCRFETLHYLANGPSNGIRDGNLFREAKICYGFINLVSEAMLNLPAELERLARLVAVKSGKTPEAVVREGVETQAKTLGLVAERDARPVDMEKIDALTRRCASRPLRDGRSAKDILDEAWGDPA